MTRFKFEISARTAREGRGAPAPWGGGSGAARALRALRADVPAKVEASATRHATYGFRRVLRAVHRWCTGCARMSYGDFAGEIAP
ncbi:hypothetical protein [uncultured Roseobacter sp.]|uniref:hypothetical protein n=1 Tax=uncultured Roseobacter sp. TaxID=114847 RepID=UPI002601F273|nr:hypothetical protein [uncultured Roseobacter sp.]